MDEEGKQLFLGSIKEMTLTNQNGVIESLEKESEVVDNLNNKIDIIGYKL